MLLPFYLVWVGHFAVSHNVGAVLGTQLLLLQGITSQTASFRTPGFERDAQADVYAAVGARIQSAPLWVRSGPGISGNTAERSSRDTFWLAMRARVAGRLLPVVVALLNGAQGECYGIGGLE